MAAGRAGDDHAVLAPAPRAMRAAVREAGFRAEEIAGPDPAPGLAATDPRAHAHVSRSAQFPFFSLARA